jgi:feruloyl-CoA synthase
MKLVPNSGKLEVRFRGPNVMPGYWREPGRNATAFDEEGFYRIGDALKFVDPARPEEGLLFDGRISEDFKLSSGTWVSVGGIREKVIRLGAPLVQDVVVTGHDRDFVAAIVFPRLDECRRLAGDLPADAAPEAAIARAQVRAAFAKLLNSLAVESTGSANRVERLVIADFMPSLDLGEITDKGSINQRAVLEHRTSLVEALYADAPAELVIRAGR